MDITLLKMIAEHKAALAWFEQNQIDNVQKAAAMVIDCFKGGGKVLLCGNGGSAADCQHIAGELVGRFRHERQPLPAVALTTDSSVLTCLGNDYQFQQIFSRQVEALALPGDVLWAFSTSGASANVLMAAKAAKSKQCKVLAFTGKRDTPLEQLADLTVCVPAEMTSTSQEIHQLAYHILCALVEKALAELSGAAR